MFWQERWLPYWYLERCGCTFQKNPFQKSVVDENCISYSCFLKHIFVDYRKRIPKALHKSYRMQNLQYFCA